MYAYCIIGFGIAGQLLVLELNQRGVSSKDICICDENFLGGSLITQYGSVQSNTPWSKTKQALLKYQPWSQRTIHEFDKLYVDTECMPVRDIAKACLQTAEKCLHNTEKITTCVNNLTYDTSTGLWKIQHTYGSIEAKTVFLAHGAKEKQLNLDKPTIPLSIALDKIRLKDIVSSEKDYVAVFGLSHSGTIVLKHLHELGIEAVGIYNTETPFLFSRDGVYDGIKEGSERIADSILRGDYSNTKLVSYSNSIEIYKALTKTTKVIYCVGFCPKPIGTIDLQYTPETAKIGPNMYGYGIAFPGITQKDGKSYSDVSVASFQEQICRTLPIQ